MLSTAMTVLAKKQETYLSELRLIYADSYKEALRVLEGTRLEGFKVLNENLNAGSGEIGVWLAYKTTEDINEAITDLAVMQMGGSYHAANYRELIESTMEEYLEMGEIYLQAVDYFMQAYDDGSLLADAAYRQLNFYCGLDHYDDERLGDLFVGAYLTESDLATLFLQGNAYVLKNIRSLLAMGVSYNEDGTHYLEKVGESAEMMDADPNVFDGEDYDVLTEMIAPTIVVFRTMLHELSAYEDELDYSDDTFTDLEIRYSEYKAVAEMLRATPYLGGKTLYDFCMNYETDPDDDSSLYPLAAALNEGQAAMVTASCYYDIVRYSMTETPEEAIDEEISRLEEEYGETPIDVYTGVDRSIYEDTFALTNAAFRTDAYTDGNTLAEALFGSAWVMKESYVSSSAVNVALDVWSIKKNADLVTSASAAESAAKAINRYVGMVKQVQNALAGETINAAPFINSVIKKYTFFDLVYDFLYQCDENLPDKSWTFDKLYDCFKYEFVGGGIFKSEEAKILMKLISSEVDSASSAVVQKAPKLKTVWTELGAKFTTLFYFLDSALLATSALSMYAKVYQYYHPVYDDIPTAMVDIVNNGERDVYVKYDVVYEAVAQKDGGYCAGDLNAFEGQRWNALYYTKSADAGKPLFAEFTVSNVSNRAGEGYLAVHRFDEVICYDLNKYNYSSKSDNIFLSVERSENSKSGAAEVPAVVGAMFGEESAFLVCGIGLALGVGGTLGVQFLLNKKKKENSDDAVSAETENN